LKKRKESARSSSSTKDQSGHSINVKNDKFKKEKPSINRLRSKQKGKL
jgi:hypothetical protein